MADAVGTQTETVLIRGMSAGIPIRRMAARELLTGLVIGALISSVFFLFAVTVWGNASVAATVAISLLVSCAVATVVAMALSVRAGEARSRPRLRLWSPRNRHPGPPLDPGLLRDGNASGVLSRSRSSRVSVVE